jgi:DNA-binding winged helix-turn-helix (wHTH) protein/tetratricopeptide (TPR) repeat protein
MNQAGTATERRTYQFDEFLVDPVRRVLLRDGEPVSVTPKALSILMVLLERPGEVVDKAELFQKVWPDTRVTEANLTQNVSFLRKALGERADQRRYVVTVPGQGYCFGGAVVVRAEAPAQERPVEVGPAEVRPAMPQSPEPPPARRRGGAVALALALMATLAAAGMWLTSWGGVQPRPAASSGSQGGRGARADGAQSGVSARPAVAVLGFEDLSGTREAQWLAPALSEILTTELGAGSTVRMVSGENVARARQALSLPYSESGEGYDLRRLRSFLNADLVVVGSYRYEAAAGGRQIHLKVRVLKIPEGVAVAALEESGTEADLLELVARTGSDLRHALGLADLSPEEAREAQAQHPASPEAARLYTQGLAHLRTFDFLAARDRLSQAAEADPGSALIRSALSQAWADLGYDTRAVSEAGKARQLASLLSREEKLQLDARFYAAGRQWGKAAEIYRSLWTFFPDDLEYGLRLAEALSRAGRGKEAMEIVAAMRKLPKPASDDPRIDLQEAWAANSMADMATVERAAKAAAAKGRRSGESLIVADALLDQGAAPVYTGHPRDGLPFFHEARDLYDRAGYRWGVARSTAHIALALYRNGDFAASEKAYQEAVDVSQQIGNVMGMMYGLGNLGYLYQSEGDLNRATSFLEKSLAYFPEIDDPGMQERLLVSLGAVQIFRGDLEAARRSTEEALVMSRRTGNKADEGRALGNLGILMAAHGNLKQARSYLDQSVGLLREVHDPSFATPMVVEAVDVAARLGDAAAARAQAEQALAAARQAGSRLGTARLLGALARLSLRSGDVASARKQAEEQLRIAREIGARDLIAGALQSLGRAALASGDLPGARAALQESVQTSDGGGEALLSAATRLDLAHLSLLEARPAQAAELARGVADWYGARQIRVEEARALSLLAEALFQQGLVAQARQAAGRARSQAEESDDLQMRIEISARLSAIEAARRTS